MRASLVFALLFWLAQSSFADITQKTAGWCAPAVADTHGNVNIYCNGVDPKALARLNELLNKKDLELAQKVKEAEEWARKYRELSERLTQEAHDTPLVRRAEALVKEGKLEEAGQLLDRLIASGEGEAERLASHHASRGAIYFLQGRPLEALPFSEKAYRYRPEDPRYGFMYAMALVDQKHFVEAEAILGQTLDLYRKLAKESPPAYLPKLAMTLEALGVVYGNTQRLNDAERVLHEALGLYRQLAVDSGSSADLSDVAQSLCNLGAVYMRANRLTDAEQALRQALGVYRDLASANLVAYRFDLTRTLTALSAVYIFQQRWTEADKLLKEYIAIMSTNPTNQ